ncbi:cytochrome ubiquinol oxidase subunit I [Salinarimonas soli]|uniref:Cytochrome ubiquinol oxidase subunit I n=1 Tax=Salinarimonas soli TaxID=1638099 RepID=A0A5B2VCV3_9HYPH|nr:cytochrome ubiquinol oxidase subunit I [Salinarimonas soli]KAA2236588.1 cytochrome ubiquinol oxidase subunit I [Salinarimonas soli]
MDAVDVARMQFAFTIAFHILWPTFTIGLAVFLAGLSLAWWRTGRTVYRDLLRFWSRIFALAFGLGVISGIVLSYQIGANWAGFSRSVSNVIGPFLMYEALTAFFLEAGFIGIVLVGEKRVGRGAYAFACCMVALGTLLSTTWIIAANSWMQTPGGAVADANGIFHVVDWWAAVFTPSFPYRLAHMVCASLVTTSFMVAGISAVHLWRGMHGETARMAFSIAMWAALVLTPAQIVLGDLHGRNTFVHQPAKLAAMEGAWETRAGAPMTIFAWPDMTQARNLYAVEVPHVASLYLTHSWDGVVRGLKEFPRDQWPVVPIVFFAFRIMVGIGLLLALTAVIGAVLRWRGRLTGTRWFLALSMAVAPLGFVAVLAGWITTETGRQPYVVYGLLRTADAASPLQVGAVTASFAMFVAVYGVLFAAFVWFLARLVWAGPAIEEGDVPLSPDAAAPVLAARPRMGGLRHDAIPGE